MSHFLVAQLRFTRSEWRRGLEGVTPEEALQRFMPMNSISWMIGHLANQEHRYWVVLAQGYEIAPELRRFGFGQPASTPPLPEVWAAWQAVTEAADRYLDTLMPEALMAHLQHEGEPVPESVGTMLLRNIYHYWYHLGEALAVRQMLGHTDLPQFVSRDMTAYRAE
jgi:hypothetical protein